MNPENLCHQDSCPAACCKNSYIQMTPQEYEVFSANPTQTDVHETSVSGVMLAMSLQDLRRGVSLMLHGAVDDIGTSHFEPISHTVGFFNSACPNLEGDQCGIYDNRPVDCRNLEIGSESCRRAIKQINTE